MHAPDRLPPAKDDMTPATEDSGVYLDTDENSMADSMGTGGMSKTAKFFENSRAYLKGEKTIGIGMAKEGEEEGTVSGVDSMGLARSTS